MSSRGQKIRVGVFAAVITALVVIVIVVFGGVRFWEKHTTYRIVFSGSVMGLEKGAQVYLNGMRVGRVDEIAVDPTDLGNVLVEISVKKDTPVRPDTKAMLGMAGITGLKVIDLQGGTIAKPVLAENEVIATGQTTLDKLGKQAADLADQSMLLMKRANQIVDNLVAITDPKKYEAIDEIMRQVRKSVDNLAVASEEVHAMVGENRAIVKATLEDIHHTANSAAAMLDGQITGLVVNAGAFVSDLKSLLRTNEGSLRSAMYDLRQASRNFKELSRDVRQKPSRLLFSGEVSERKLP